MILVILMVAAFLFTCWASWYYTKTHKERLDP